MQAPGWVIALPTVNASLNALAAVLLLFGYRSIRRQDVSAHKRSMLLAFSASIVFLACYLVYHAALYHYTGEGSKRFPGEGTVRAVYLAILISHVVLAVTVPVLAPVTIFRGLKAERETDENAARQKWDRHRKIARVTFPIWLYVSVTGVIIYLMLYHWDWGAG